MISAKDLIKLLLLVTPKQLGLDKLRDLFDSATLRNRFMSGLKILEKKEVEIPPYYELVDVIYELQKTDTEAPVVEVVRRELNNKIEEEMLRDEKGSIRMVGSIGKISTWMC